MFKQHFMCLGNDYYYHASDTQTKWYRNSMIIIK